MKSLKRILLFTVALSAFQAQADSVVPAIPGATLDKVQPASGKVVADAHDVSATSRYTASGDVDTDTSGTARRDAEILALKQKLDQLEQRSRVAEAIGNSTQKPDNAEFVGADTVYDYRDGGVYRVYCGVEGLTDIALQPGETIAKDGVVAGDTRRWVVKIINSGVVPNEVQHVMIKPIQHDLHTTVDILTDRHVYKLMVWANRDWGMPGVKWNYPQEDAISKSIAVANEKKMERQAQPTSVTPDKLDFNYTIRGDDVAWKPAQVFSDGKKTYLKMPPSMTTSEAPALFVLDESNNTMLVNYRLKDNVYIVDRLFDKAVLKVGADQEVQITHRSSSGGWFSANSSSEYPRSGK